MGYREMCCSAGLGEKKIAKAIVRCDIQLYRSGDKKETPPEITKTVEISVHEGQDPFEPSQR
jgi:hypothetical protein